MGLTLARVLVKHRDYRKAIGVAHVFDTAWPSVYLLYAPASLELSRREVIFNSEENFYGGKEGRSEEVRAQSRQASRRSEEIDTAKISRQEIGCEEIESQKVSG
jgi:hypothetical protein